MFRIQTLNRIASKGLELFDQEKYRVVSDTENPDAILVRSFNMHEIELPPALKAIARAGTGVNNIPIEKCCQRGIVVFNTPGANANSVKELVLGGLFLASRKIYQGISWVKSLAGKEDLSKRVEKEKSAFGGPEIKGKKLGVIGLGKIGVMVANDAEKLGMKVTGYDPFISVEAAWGLSSTVKRANSLDTIFSDSDYITLHVPLTDKTMNMIDHKQFSKMKKGIRLLNFARGGLINNKALKEALEMEIVECYITDFPTNELLFSDKVIPLPHLGASTPEAEENCAVMAAEQVKNFLEKGNILNSVNFPDCEMELTREFRIVVANRNIPRMIGQITTILSEEKINIADMLNQHKDEYAYNIIDTDDPVPEQLLEKIRKIEGVLMARAVSSK